MIRDVRKLPGIDIHFSQEERAVTKRPFAVASAAAALAAAGVLALWWPVYLDQYDQYGVQISCGRAVAAGLSQDVLSSSDGEGLLDRCGTALLIRRAWAIPLVLIGWLVLTGVLIDWLHHAPQGQEEDAPNLADIG